MMKSAPEATTWTLAGQRQGPYRKVEPGKKDQKGDRRGDPPRIRSSRSVVVKEVNFGPQVVMKIADELCQQPEGGKNQQRHQDLLEPVEIEAVPLLQPVVGQESYSPKTLLKMVSTCFR